MWWKKAAGPWNYGLANNAGSLTAGIFFRLNMEQQYVYSTVIPYEQSADGKAYWVPEEDITYPIGLFRQGKMWNRRGMWKKKPDNKDNEKVIEASQKRHRKLLVRYECRWWRQLEDVC